MTTDVVQRPKVTYQTDVVYETKAVTKPKITMEVRVARGARGARLPRIDPHLQLGWFGMGVCGRMLVLSC
jgi:hypothetical protein